jgi:hypothetical protein
MFLGRKDYLRPLLNKMDIELGTVTSTVPRYGHLRSNGFDWLKVFLQKNKKKGTLITS